MYEKITLKNGVRIVFERIPHVRSVSVGLWVGCGSRLEQEAESGASHFIEHMLFKGTATRSAAELAALMDGIGGQMNAFTTKECTCYYGRVLDVHFKAALDILFDMFFHSSFDDGDIQSEQGIIYEEIDMYEDSPDDLVTERLLTEVYRGSALSRPILGSRETLARMDGAFLRDFKTRHYVPGRIVVAVSGSFSDADIDYMKGALASLPAAECPAPAPADYTPAFTQKRKPIEQNHLCLAFPGLPMGSGDRYAMQLLSTILGGGMSSRLFQTVRERHGLCYSVYSFGTAYQDTGLLGIYAALNADTEAKALSLILEVLRTALADGVSQDELHRAREQVKSNVLMSLESTNARMNRIGKNTLFLDMVPSVEEVVAAYDAVSRDDILALARRHLDLTRLSFSAVGQVADTAHYRTLLEA